MMHVVIVALEVVFVLAIAALFWVVGDWAADLLVHRYDEEEE